MLGKAPTATELNDAFVVMASGQPLSVIVDQILRSSAYAATVPT